MKKEKQRSLVTKQHMTCKVFTERRNIWARLLFFSLAANVSMKNGVKKSLSLWYALFNRIYMKFHFILNGLGLCCSLKVQLLNKSLDRRWLNSQNNCNKTEQKRLSCLAHIAFEKERFMERRNKLNKEEIHIPDNIIFVQWHTCMATSSKEVPPF